MKIDTIFQSFKECSIIFPLIEDLVDKLGRCVFILFLIPIFGFHNNMFQRYDGSFVRRKVP